MQIEILSLYSPKSISILISITRFYSRIFGFCFILLLLTNYSFCQVNGRVIDSESREPLIGAVVQDDQGHVSTTINDGSFFLSEDSGQIHSLIIRYVGYNEETLTVKGSKNVGSIALVPAYLNIEEVVVTAPAISSKLKLSTGPIGLLSADVIKESSGVSLAESLNRLPGVYMASGTYSTNRLIIRGIGSRTPYSTNRIRAYYGDIPLTSGDGTTTIEDIDAAAIGRIEVIRGPESAGYGSGLGGVLRILPYFPSGHGFHSKLSSQAGSFGTYRNVLESGFNNDKISLRGVYSNTNSKGYRENSAYSRNSLYLTCNIPEQKNNTTILLSYTGVQAYIPSSIDKLTFENNPDHAAQNWLDIKGFEKDKRLLGGVTFTHYFNTLLSNKLTVFSSFSRHYESRPFNILSDEAFSTGFREQLGFRTGAFRINTGTEVYSEKYNWSIFRTISGRQGDLQNKYSENRSYLNAFGHMEVAITDKLRFESGVNFNILKYTLMNKLIPGAASDSYVYKPVLSPRAGVNFRLSRACFPYIRLPDTDFQLLPLKKRYCLRVR